MKTYTPDELQAILRAHVAWLRSEANGKRADFSYADLTGADLGFADLRGADLTGADFRDADLRDAKLRGAILSYADLTGADLGFADLTGADLGFADLTGADLSYAGLRDAKLSYAKLRGAKISDSTIMPSGYTFAVYKTEVVTLLTAGGKTLAEVVGAWGCHDWANCPIATAFGVHSIAEMPPLYREQARLFVQFFDARLLPKPKV